MSQQQELTKPPRSDLVTTNEAADELGLTTQALRNLTKQGFTFWREGRTLLWHLPTLVAERRAKGCDSSRRNSGTGRAPDIDAARLRKENALADKYELHVSRERGELIPLADAKRLYGNFVSVMRNRLQRIGVTVANEFCGTDAARIQTRIDEEVAMALREVSHADEPNDGILAASV